MRCSKTDHGLPALVKKYSQTTSISRKHTYIVRVDDRGVAYTFVDLSKAQQKKNFPLGIT